MDLKEKKQGVSRRRRSVVGCSSASRQPRRGRGPAAGRRVCACLCVCACQRQEGAPGGGGGGGGELGSGGRGMRTALPGSVAARGRRG